MKNVLIADPLQRDIEDVTHFFVENGFTAKDGKLTRAERRRQEKQKDTVYHLTKSQIDAIKRQAVKEVTDRYKDLEW